MRRFHSRTLNRIYPKAVTARVAIVSLVVAIFMGIFASETLFAQQAKWIWNSGQINGNTPHGSVHFRKRFSLPKPVVAELVLAADDEFEVYFNGELIGYGNGYRKLTKIDLTPQLVDGENLLAIRATNIEGNTGALAAIARFRLEGETAWRWLATDETWVSEVSVAQSWKNIEYSDESWRQAQTLGAFGSTAPWDNSRMSGKQKATGVAASRTTMQPPTTPTVVADETPVPPAKKGPLEMKTRNVATATPTTSEPSMSDNAVATKADTLSPLTTKLTPAETVGFESPQHEPKTDNNSQPVTTQPELTPPVTTQSVSKTDTDLAMDFSIPPATSVPTQQNPALNPPGNQNNSIEKMIPGTTPENMRSNPLSISPPKSEPRSTAGNSTENIPEREREFVVPENFAVQQILDGSVGSLIAMEFNEFGQLVLSREGGKLLLCDISGAEAGKVTVRQCCDVMENVQGILPLNGDLFVTGDGPDGLGLYRLSDKDRDGMYEAGPKMVGFKGRLGEHGPHGITLGPDGMLYIVLGNASGIEGKVHPNSPSTHFHEGDVLPRLSDPGGHAAGVKAPGGTIVRISPDGQRREIFASGVRNAYDLAFNQKGDLFIHDSDMESDIGTPWYRPTQVFHATAGGEYGWRSGTAKFPGYFIDTIPGIADTGRGSPTGAVVYDHVMMPVRYHGALFLGDWSEGRILAVRMKPKGDSYETQVETFLSSQPLTVTDLTVGPDGALYFSTGGRGTQGGVYRVAWDGQVPDEFRLLTDKLSQLVGRPQPQSAWTRQDLAKLRKFMGEEWAVTLNGILMEPRNDSSYRIRALEILGLYGPAPTDRMLAQLAADTDSDVRERAINLISWRTAEEFKPVVVKALSDTSPRVRRAACESLRHMGHTTLWTNYVQSLASSSRTEAMAARRLLEATPVNQWRDSILEVDDLGVFLQGATALMIVEPKMQNAYRVLARVTSVMDGFVTDSQFVDLLRVTQLALDQAEVDPSRIPAFHDRILAEFPSGNGVLNRELSRIIGYLKDARVASEIQGYLAESTDTDLDKLQVILNLGTIADEFTDDQRIAVISFIEKMKTNEEVSESNYSLYLTSILGTWSDEVSDTQVSEILKNGAKWPSAALSAFYKLPEQLTEQQIEWITQMDQQLKERTDSAALQARIGCVAVLGRSGDDKSMYYLREVWRHEPDRRNNVVLALAQKPDGPNWPYLISSLGDLSDDTAGEVLAKLATVNQSPKEPKFLKDAILTGYRLRQSGVQSANQLLQHWTGHKVEKSDWQSTIRSWAEWFNERYPDEQPISFEDQQTIGNYSVDEILSYIESSARTAPGPGDLHRGMALFSKAQCSQCHRFNGQGEAMGPDLSSIGRRFSKRETLRSILHPSEIIPSQYAGKKVLTVDGQQHIGLVSEAGNGAILVLTDSGKKLTLASNEVEDIVDAETSAMPNGLLDHLTLPEINDLMNFIYSQSQTTADMRNQGASQNR